MKKALAILVLVSMPTLCMAFTPAVKGVLGVGATGNDFTFDTNCVAFYRFESGAITADSKGVQTLTDVNDTGTSGTYKEGAASADFNGTDEYLYRNDADLVAGFPFKSDDATKVGTFCGWMRIDDAPGEGTENIIVRKYGGGTDAKRSFSLGISDALTVSLLLGVDGGADLESKAHASTLDAATWYFVCASYENAGKTWAIRVRDTDGAVVGSDATGTLTGTFNVEDSPFTIGAGKASGGTTDYWDGLIDSVIIFKDVLTAAEVTKIAKGIYP